MLMITLIDYSLDDDNRVILDPLENEPECQHDYINASYIKVLYPHSLLF